MLSTEVEQKENDRIGWRRVRLKN